jgi:hypothetical protein
LGITGNFHYTVGRRVSAVAGFTNQKAVYRTLSGNAPWVSVRHAQAGLASGAGLLETVEAKDAVPDGMLSRSADTG